MKKSNIYSLMIICLVFLIYCIICNGQKSFELSEKDIIPNSDLLDLHGGSCEGDPCGTDGCNCELETAYNTVCYIMYAPQCDGCTTKYQKPICKTQNGSTCLQCECASGDPSCLHAGDTLVCICVLIGNVWLPKCQP